MIKYFTDDEEDVDSLEIPSSSIEDSLLKLLSKDDNQSDTLNVSEDEIVNGRFHEYPDGVSCKTILQYSTIISTVVVCIPTMVMGVYKYLEFVSL